MENIKDDIYGGIHYYLRGDLTFSIWLRFAISDSSRSSIERNIKCEIEVKFVDIFDKFCEQKARHEGIFNSTNLWN